MSQHSTAQCRTAPRESSSIPCNLCGGAAVSLLASHSRSGAPLRTVICVQCGLVWTDPFPHNPRSFYEDDYRVSYKDAYSPKPKHIFRAGNVAVSRYRKLARFLPRSHTILDVGSGGGEFAYLLQSLGHDVWGIEPNRGYAEYSIREYGLNVYRGFVQDLKLPKTSPQAMPSTGQPSARSIVNQVFDTITIWHVLEHTENPYAVLAKLNTC